MGCGGYRDTPQIATILTIPSAGYLYRFLKNRRCSLRRLGRLRLPTDRYTSDHTPYAAYLYGVLQ
jgi:hypothetical protein